MFTYDYNTDTFWCRHKLSNGQYCMVSFDGFSEPGDSIWNYNVAFAVADKKKQLKAWFEGTKDNTITLKSTGKCGIEALFWARDRILEFELRVKEGSFWRVRRPVAIWITGEDARRFRVYERAMSRYGYSKVPSPGGSEGYGWYMRKVI